MASRLLLLVSALLLCLVLVNLWDPFWFWCLLVHLLILIWCQVSCEANTETSQVVKGSNRRLLQFISMLLWFWLFFCYAYTNGNGIVCGCGGGGVDCGELCKVRCAKARKNVCLRACGTCCFRCKCVPPGTFGNREKCGRCYTDMTTHGNKPKCP